MAKSDKKKEDTKKPTASSDASEKAGRSNDATPKQVAGGTTSRPHLVRGGILLGVGALGTLALMAYHERVMHGPLYGILLVLLSVVGLLDVLGMFRTTAGTDVVPFQQTAFGRKEGEPELFAPKYAATAAALVLLAGGIVLGFARLPWVIAASLAILTLPALRRPGLAVFVIGSALYLPMLGAYGLWDPWETHYGEVSREILARQDWISLWWAQEDWFFSKPILIFWADALSMGALGVPYMPDHFPAHAEWALRLPIYLISMGALLAVYAAISRVWSKRAGVVAATVLATMPHFFFLAHQAITDIYFVAPMTIAVCLLVLALQEDPDREVRRYRVPGLGIELSAQHALLAAVVAVALPQALYLITRNVELVAGGFAWGRDHFKFGSAGNEGVPGNSPHRDVEPFLNGILAQPIVQGLLWLAGLAVIVMIIRAERRAQPLQMLAFYLFCALGFMGKGIPGIALPGIVALLYLIASRRWNVLLEGRLKIAPGILITSVVGLPWFVAMYIRHGPQFTDRLLVHDHINRLASGVHGDTGSVSYFVEQLGYSMFPWVALAPAAITMWLRARREDEEAQANVATETVPAPASVAASDAPAGASAEKSADAPAAAAVKTISLADKAQKMRIEGALWVGGGVIASLVGLLVLPSGGFIVFVGAIGWGLRQLIVASRLDSAAATPEGQQVVVVEQEPGGGPVHLPALAPSQKSTEPSGLDHRRETLVLLGLWFVGSFVLFSAMITKFHHYIFPAVPAAAILIGIFVDRMLGASPAKPSAKWRAASIAAYVAPVLLVLGVAGLRGPLSAVVPAVGEPPKLVKGLFEDWAAGSALRAARYGTIPSWLPESMRAGWASSTITTTLLWLGVGLVGVAVAVWAAMVLRQTAATSRTSWATRAWMGAAVMGGPIVLAFVGRDLAWVTDARPAGYERLIHLFVYNYDRPWPPTLDFRAFLTGFAVVAALVCTAAVFHAIRPVAARALLGLSVFFTMWTLDVYMVQLSPHWGQKELFERYFQERRGPDEQIVAWQMNWKGENFYTGNHVAAFVDLDNRQIRTWIDSRRGKRAFFVLEHSRLGSFRSLVPGREIDQLTDERLNNKFTLIAVDL